MPRVDLTSKDIAVLIDALDQRCRVCKEAIKHTAETDASAATKGRLVEAFQGIGDRAMALMLKLEEL